MTNSRQTDIAGIARALADRAEHVATWLLGKPSQSSRHEQRWGRHGSMALHRSGTKRGLWFDHERGQGGDLLHLIARERNVRLAEAATIAQREFIDVSNIAPARIERGPSLEQPVNSEARCKAALRIWSETVPLTATLAEAYFVDHRGLDVMRLDVSHAVRWHGGLCAIVALMTDAASGERRGIHRTFLNGDGTKRERKMLGPQGVVRLSPDAAVAMGLGITEGIEDALAVLCGGWAPVWAATSSGAIARIPVLSGIEALTLFADTDAPGMRAAETCRVRWLTAGCEARIVTPKERHQHD